MQQPQQAFDQQNQRALQGAHGKGAKQHRQVAQVQLVKQHNGNFHQKQQGRNGGQNGDGGYVAGGQGFFGSLSHE